MIFEKSGSLHSSVKESTCRFDAGYRMLGAGALGWTRGMVWGGRWERDSGWGTCVHPWRMHVDVWQNQYNIVNWKKKTIIIIKIIIIKKRIHLQCRRPWFNSCVGKICWRRNRLPTPVFLAFLCGPAGKESTWNAGHLGSILGLGRFPGKGKGCTLQYSDHGKINILYHF